MTMVLNQQAAANSTLPTEPMNLLPKSAEYAISNQVLLTSISRVQKQQLSGLYCQHILATCKSLTPNHEPAPPLLHQHHLWA